MRHEHRPEGLLTLNRPVKSSRRPMKSVSPYRPCRARTHCRRTGLCWRREQSAVTQLQQYPQGPMLESVCSGHFFLCECVQTFCNLGRCEKACRKKRHRWWIIYEDLFIFPMQLLPPLTPGMACRWLHLHHVTCGMSSSHRQPVVKWLKLMTRNSVHLPCHAGSIPGTSDICHSGNLQGPFLAKSLALQYKWPGYQAAGPGSDAQTHHGTRHSSWKTSPLCSLGATKHMYVSVLYVNKGW